MSSSYQIYQQQMGRSVSPQKQVRFQPDSSSIDRTHKKGTQSISSPQRNYATNSPSKEIQSELYRDRVSQLEKSLTQANTDLDLANYKAKKAKELETRIDLILKQNAQLLSENDQLQKYYNQKKTESEIWKSKYENQMNTIIGMKANYELELKKMASENQRNKEYIGQLSESKFQDVEMTKEKMFQDQSEKIESLKKNHNKNIQLYEEQIRKLQDIIQNRDQEILEIKDRLSFTKSDQEMECIRLNEDREKLRNRVQAVELELQKQLDAQRMKKDVQYNEQIMALKSLHANEIDTYESELKKLKKLITAKNQEIDTLLHQNKQQQENFDCHQNDLKNEIYALKEKLNEHFDLKEDEINDLKEKLAHLHTVDINDLKDKHDQYIDTLHGEIDKVKNLLAIKTADLQDQINTNQHQQDNFLHENDALKHELALQQKRNDELQQEMQAQQSEAQNKFEKNLQNFENNNEQLRNQIKFLEDQIDSLKQQLVKKNNEIDELISKQKVIKSQLDDQIRTLRNSLHETKQQLEQVEYDLEKITEEKDHKYNISQTTWTDRLRKVENEQADCETTIKKLKEIIDGKEVEIQHLLEHKQQKKDEIARQKKEIENYQKKLVEADKLRASQLEEQRLKMEESNEFCIQSLKESSDNQIKVLNEHLDQSKKIIEHKDNEIQDIVSKYDKMSQIFKELQSSKEQHDPEYNQKLQKLGQEIVTTKNLYDVFVMSKSRYQKRASKEKQQE